MANNTIALTNRLAIGLDQLNNFILYLLRPYLIKFPAWVTPNRLSASRIPLAIIIIYILTNNYNDWFIFSLILLAGITDMLDGKLAESKKLITDLGKTLDRTVDKIFTIPLLIALIFTETAWIIPALIYVIFDGISLYQTVDRLIRGIPLSPSTFIGKMKFILVFFAMTLYPIIDNYSWAIDWFLLLPATFLAGWSMIGHTKKEIF